MFTFPRSVRMPGAVAGCHGNQIVEFVPAVFAGVLALFRAFIESVFPFSGPIRMAWAGAGRKTADIIELVAAIDAVKIRHRDICYKSFIAICAQASASASAWW